MSSSRKKTSFNSDWLLKEKFESWLGQIEKDSFSAYCKLCSKSFILSNMGEQALTSYMNGKKHKRAESNTQKA